jgi:hypothetical protein
MKMKGTEKSQTYEALLKLIVGHFSAHKMAQWEQEGVIERLGELLVKRIYKRFDVKFKEVSSPNPYGDDDYAVPVK